ncbi:PREDICTED: putative phospholipase B-like 2 isoform X4 [Papilio polytes]|uniref:putative phospholipase B-like 2 isoform X4 n=1 Tax=Papilio polytes TaxID=76194 RepID=UPI0006764F71|nr:PREDICTED: putative phospholipase B-like 2 isoform X4 [Papilio polytes]
MKIYSQCSLLFILTTVTICETKYGYVTWQENKLTFKDCESASQIPITFGARATFKNEINSTGWAFLEVHTSKDVTDEQQAYAAGFIEGYLTRDLIWMHWQNMLKGWINMLGDLDDLAFSLALPKDLPDGLLFGDHCTGLIKLLPDFTNLYTAHTTWNSYQSMLRLQKMYVLHYKISPLDKKRIPGYKMAFTSYPAFVQYMSALRQSTDDFYIISSGLVAGETTISNSNKTLFDLINPLCVMEYIRGMIANRLAVDGYQWTRIFRQHNSGTYNNQWYIVDYNKFTPTSKGCKGKAEKGLLWVLEQLPGYTETADLTEQLVNTTYFPSYNIPYFPTIFNLSGGNVRVATFGDWFGYKTNPRANILKEKQAGITNLRDMFNTMRYNDFKHDPLSRCACVPPYSACNAIAARNDLNPANGTFPFRALGHRSHGGTDAKVTSWHLRNNYEFVAVSGPTFNISRGIPPFAWSEFDMGPHLPHIGHPDLWAFQPIIHHWEWA